MLESASVAFLIVKSFQDFSLFYLSLERPNRYSLLCLIFFLSIVDLIQYALYHQITQNSLFIQSHSRFQTNNGKIQHWQIFQVAEQQYQQQYVQAMEKLRNNNFLGVNTPVKGLRFHPLPDQSNISPHILQEPEMIENDLIANERGSRDKSLQSKRSKISQISQFSKIQKGKQAMNKTLIQMLEKVNKRLRTTQKIQIAKISNQLKQYTDFEEYIDHYFDFYNKFYRLVISDQQPSIPIDLKLKKKIVFTKQSPEKYSRRAQLEQANKENFHLKKQVARLKQTITSLQKRIIRVVTQYKQRKQVYLAQIQKLTNIISSSIGKIPQLLIENNKRLKQSSRKKLSENTEMQRLNLNTKQSEYNTLTSAGNPQNGGFQANFREFSFEKIGSWPRIKSQERLHVAQ